MGDYILYREQVERVLFLCALCRTRQLITVMQHKAQHHLAGRQDMFRDSERKEKERTQPERGD